MVHHNVDHLLYTCESDVDYWCISILYTWHLFSQKTHFRLFLQSYMCIVPDGHENKWI